MTVNKVRCTDKRLGSSLESRDLLYVITVELQDFGAEKNRARIQKLVNSPWQLWSRLTALLELIHEEDWNLI